MADLGGVFDSTTVDPSPGGGPLPAGKYRCAVIKSENKPNSKGTGTFLELTLEVLDGKYKGKRVWDRLNLQNPNQTTVDMARATLSAICRATGVLKPTDSVQLHNIPIIVGVKVKTRNDAGHVGEKSNEVDSYESTDKASAAPAPEASSDDTPPWEG